VATAPAPHVAICLASDADWEVLLFTGETLDQFSVPWIQVKTGGTDLQLPETVTVVIAASGRRNLAAELAGHTPLPILAVPIDDTTGAPLETLTAAAAMPAGTAVGLLALGKAGAINAALGAVGILSLADAALRERWREYRRGLTEGVLASRLE